LKCKDAKLQGIAITRLQQLALCLEGRSDREAEAFLLKCFENTKGFAAIKSEPSGTDFNELLAQLLARGTPKMQQQLVAARGELRGGMLPPAVFAARANMDPADFYREFSPWLKGISENRKKSGEIDRGTALIEVLKSQNDRLHYRGRTGYFQHDHEHRTPALRELDPRWLDATIEVQLIPLVCMLARADHPGTNKFLSEQFAGRKKPHESYQSQTLLQTMVRIEHPAAADAIIDALKRHAKETHYYYVGYWYGRMILDLPRSSLAKFEELLPTLPDKMVDQLMDSILALKNKPE
jgi:hypothetical protein